MCQWHLRSTIILTSQGEFDYLKCFFFPEKKTWYVYISQSCIKLTLEKIKVPIKNRQSRVTGNIGYIIYRTEKNKTENQHVQSWQHAPHQEPRKILRARKHSEMIASTCLAIVMCEGQYIGNFITSLFN